MDIGILPVCISMYHLFAGNPQRSEKRKRSPETGVTDNCEAPCGRWNRILVTSKHSQWS